MTEIVPAEEKYLDDMLALEAECFSRPWSRQSFAFELKSEDARFVTAVDGEKVAGFAIMHRLCDDGELFNIAVAPEYRRQGIGAALLADVMAAAPDMGVRRLYLEVRRSNEAAAALYRRAGFQVCGARKNYYDDPTEDAVLMEAEIC